VHSSVNLAAAFGFLGLPVGYFWTYAIYHPIIWKNTSRTWNDFAEWMGKHLTNGLGQSASPEEARLIANRAYSYLRWTNPTVGRSLVAFHTRHHILRSSGFVLLLGIFLTVILIGSISGPLNVSWALGIFLAALVGAILSLRASQTELETLIDHYTFVAANEASLSTWSRKFLKLLRERPKIGSNSGTVLKIVVGTSILFFYGVLVFLLGSTNLCTSFGAPQIWKYSVIASVPTWLTFLLCRTWKRGHITPLRHDFTALLALASVLTTGSVLAPFSPSLLLPRAMT